MVALCAASIAASNCTNALVERRGTFVLICRYLNSFNERCRHSRGVGTASYTVYDRERHKSVAVAQLPTKLWRSESHRALRALLCAVNAPRLLRSLAVGIISPQSRCSACTRSSGCPVVHSPTVVCNALICGPFLAEP